MIPLDEARRRVLDAVEPLAPRRLPLRDCAGSALAAPVVSDHDVFPFDNSAMDGYAVRSQDAQSPPVTLQVVGVSAAGHPSHVPVGPGQAARILTGAKLVEGADCVIKVEDTDGGTDHVEVRAQGRPGAFVRRAGDAARRGSVVLEAGTVLNPGHLGVAASVGRAELEVRPAPRVAVVSTGDELVAPGARQVADGQIFDANGVVVAALARSLGCPTSVRTCGDDAAGLATLLDDLAGTHDLVLSSGGVSMGGEYDTVKVALADRDVEFWRIAIKPAKPMGFGRLGDATFFGLPGNPVSAVVAFELFVRPAIRKFRGIEPHVVPFLEGVAGEALSHGDDGKTHLLRVRRDDSTQRWVSTGTQGSQLLGGIAAAEALAVVPAGTLEVPAGGTLELLPLWS